MHTASSVNTIASTTKTQIRQCFVMLKVLYMYSVKPTKWKQHDRQRRSLARCKFTVKYIIQRFLVTSVVKLEKLCQNEGTGGSNGTHHSQSPIRWG